MQSRVLASLWTRPEHEVSGEFPEQMQIVQGDCGPRFTFSGGSDTEVKWNLSSRTKARTYQHLQQELETSGLERNAINGFPPHHKETRHRAFNPQLSSL